MRIESGGLQITDHPVVARSPLPRDFRGLRMPHEASAMTYFRRLVLALLHVSGDLCTTEGNSLAAKGGGGKVVDSRVSALSSRDEVRVGIFRCGGAMFDWRKASPSRIPGSIGWETGEPRDELSSFSVQQLFAGFEGR